MNDSARVGTLPLPASEELGKGEGGCMQFGVLSLPYFISPFVKPPAFERGVRPENRSRSGYGTYVLFRFVHDNFTGCDLRDARTHQVGEEGFWTCWSCGWIERIQASKERPIPRERDGELEGASPARQKMSRTVLVIFAGDYQRSGLKWGLGLSGGRVLIWLKWGSRLDI